MSPARSAGQPRHARDARRGVPSDQQSRPRSVARAWTTAPSGRSWPAISAASASGARARTTPPSSPLRGRRGRGLPRERAGAGGDLLARPLAPGETCPVRGPLLDVGCYTGVFLDVAVRRGLAGDGARAQPLGRPGRLGQGAPCAHGHARHRAFPRRSFAVATMWMPSSTMPIPWAS